MHNETQGMHEGDQPCGLRAAVPHPSSNQATAEYVTGKGKSSRADKTPGG